MLYSGPANSFRLFICHDSDGLQLAVELRKQLVDYGISAFVAHESGSPPVSDSDRTRIQIALREMDGLVALVTRNFSANAGCNQEVGFALGKGVHLQCIELTGSPTGLAAASPRLSMPTDFDLPLLIGRFVARDSLVSERLRPAAVEAILQRPPDLMEDGLRFLECIAWPGDGAVDQLSRARRMLQHRLPPENMRRLDRLIERWLELADGDRSHAMIPPAPRHFGRLKTVNRVFVPLVGPI